MEKTLRDSCYCSEAPRELAVNEYIAETIRSWRLRPLRSGLRRSKQFTITLIELAELLVSPVFWGRAPRSCGSAS